MAASRLRQFPLVSRELFLCGNVPVVLYYSDFRLALPQTGYLARQKREQDLRRNRSVNCVGGSHQFLSPNRWFAFSQNPSTILCILAHIYLSLIMSYQRWACKASVFCVPSRRESLKYLKIETFVYKERLLNFLIMEETPPFLI